VGRDIAKLLQEDQPYQHFSIASLSYTMSMLILTQHTKGVNQIWST